MTKNCWRKMKRWGLLEEAVESPSVHLWYPCLRIPESNSYQWRRQINATFSYRATPFLELAKYVQEWFTDGDNTLFKSSICLVSSICFRSILWPWALYRPCCLLPDYFVIHFFKYLGMVKRRVWDAGSVEKVGCAENMGMGLDLMFHRFFLCILRFHHTVKLPNTVFVFLHIVKRRA